MFRARRRDKKNIKRLTSIRWPGFVIQEATRFSISSFTVMHANNGPFFAAYNSPMLSLHNIVSIIPAVVE